MSIVQRRLLSTYRELSAQIEGVDRWLQTPVGADLWIDGLAALRSAGSDDLFARYTAAFLDFCARAGAPVRSLDREGMAALLSRLDPFLEACAEHGGSAFWPGLAVGISLIHSLGGPPRIEVSGGATMNDTVALVLSPSYRALRFAGYNAGVSIRYSAERTEEPFRPELGYFLITPPTLIQEELPRAQFFNVSHDLGHIVLFGDAYMRPVGTPEMTAALLLNAEETACTLDLVQARDLARFGVELRALTEILQIESGQREGRPSVTLRVAREGTGFAAYQAALKASSQSHLTVGSPVSRRIRQGVAIPPDLGDWFNPRAQQTHAAWHEDLADRVWDPIFQRFVSLLPPVESHLENLHRRTREGWEPGETVLDEIPEPNPAARSQGLLLYRCRFLVVRAAETAAELAAAGSLAPALNEDLLGWALEVVDDYVRVGRHGASMEAAERCEAHLRAVRSLLDRHAIRSDLVGRFDDPVSVSLLPA
jgi:hypothetical protein